MKPLGTITMCFPFVDDISKAILERNMNDSENYADFSNRLVHYVVRKDVSPLLFYLAFYHAFHLSDYTLIEKLEKSREIPLLVNPLHLLTRYRRGVMVHWEQMESAMKTAVDAAPNDWFSCQIYLEWRYYADFNLSEADGSASILSVLSRDIMKRKDLEFFKIYLLRLQAIRHHYDAEFDKQIELMDEALSIAKQYDEQILVVDIQSGLANVIKNYDLKRAMNLLESSKSISKELGYMYNLGHLHLELGHLAGVRGEYNSSIEHILEYHRVRESLHLPVRTSKYFLATYYNLAGNGEDALRNIDDAISSYETIKKLSPYALTQRAWALTNLGEYQVAREDLQISIEIAMKTGVVWHVSIWPKIVEGILEKLEGNYQNAKVIFENVLTTFTNEPILLVKNLCYLNLAEIEIEMMDLDSLDRPRDVSGPWMEILEEYIENNDLPGIRAQMMLLKARLYQKTGLNDEAKRIVQECLDLANSSGLQYFKHILKSTIIYKDR